MMNIQLVLAKFFRSLRRNGLRTTLHEGLRLLKSQKVMDEFDLKYGTDTGGTVQLWNLAIKSPNAHFGTAYQAIEEQTLVEAIKALPGCPSNLTFVDLGCGKGKALIVAGRLGFKQVIGVEFAHELAEIARTNLEKMGIANAVVIEADAVDYRFPDGGIVVYLYNPFYREVMEKVLYNLKKSLPKELYVIYRNPRYAGLCEASGFLRRLDRQTAERKIQIWGGTAPN